MERVNKILNHHLFKKHLAENEAAERERRFCRHDLGHLLDVARIAMLINLQEGFGIEAEYVYAAALLHDIGKHIQYEGGTPHERASAELAPVILEDCGYKDNETYVIVTAIKQHRNEETAKEASLSGLLYRADKASRSCFACKAEADCNWKESKKNRTLKY